MTLDKLPHLSEQDWSELNDNMGRAKQMAGGVVLKYQFSIPIPGPEP